MQKQSLQERRLERVRTSSKARVESYCGCPNRSPTVLEPCLGRLGIVIKTNAILPRCPGEKAAESAHHPPEPNPLYTTSRIVMSRRKGLYAHGYGETDSCHIGMETNAKGKSTLVRDTQACEHSLSKVARRKQVEN